MTSGPSSPLPGARSAALTRLAAGALLVLAAVVVFAGSRLVASHQQHSYDPGAVPAASFRLTAGKEYQLSSPVGVATLRKDGLLTSLACSWSSDGNLQNPLTIDSTQTDDRDLRTFATVTAPTTGRLQISCARIAQVFVDDSDDAGRDNSALLMLASIVLGVVGVAIGVSGGYGLAELRPVGLRSAGTEPADYGTFAFDDDGDRDDLDDGNDDDGDEEPPR